MADDTVQIRFGAETSGVSAGATQVKTQLAGIRGAVSDLAAGYKMLASAATAGLADTASGARKALGPVSTAGARTAAAAGADALKASMKAAVDAQIKGFGELAQAQQKQAAEAVATARSSAAAQLAAVKQLYDLGQISAGSYFARVEALHRQDTSAQVAALRQQLAEINASYAAESAMKGLSVDEAIALDDKYLAARLAVEDRIAAAVQAGAARQLSDANAAVLKMKHQFDGLVDPMVSSFSSGLMKMAEHAETFRQFMLRIGQQVLDDFVSKVVDKEVEQWLWGVTRKVAATVTGNAVIGASNAQASAAGLGGFIAQVMQAVVLDAKRVFANIFAIMSSNPVTLPAAAPAAAAGAAAVMSFSAAGGFDIPAGVNPLTQLHQREMVLPATLANPMRAFFATAPGATVAVGGAGRGEAAAPPSVSFGDSHFHGAPNMGRDEFEGLLRDHRDLIAGAVQDIMRNRTQPRR